MPYQDVNTGENPPEKINLIIEIQRGGGRNKYEFDKDTGRLTLDRVNGTTAVYPADYGYMPGTLCEDGDPLDGLLLIDEPVVHGAVVPARPIGVLYMVDDGENDEKLVCVPADDISKAHLHELSDMSDKGENFKKVVEHFYSHYKDWKNGWQGVKIEFKGWGGAAEAKKVITESLQRASSN
ncbi:MAG TPA: inorganic diphosphatase [Candidatus Saccharimonadales bacterium]|nr:inorganic diphosphatase [Candidatus Saccharimonadales bacterium]